MAGDDSGLSLASNVGGCGVIGAIYGGVKAAWAAAPTAKAPDAQIVYSEVANTVGRTSLQFALVGGIFTLGATTAAMFRSTEDSFNYGLGGAAVGVYAGLRSGGGRLHMCVVKAVAYGVFGTAVATIVNAKSSPASGKEGIMQRLTQRYPAALTSSADKAH